MPSSAATTQSPTPDPVPPLFAAFQARLDEHERILRRCDRLEAALVVEHGYPRVRLPTPPGSPIRYAAEASTITEILAPGRRRDRCLWVLRRRRERWEQATFACGLDKAQAREAVLFRAIREAADILYAVPAATTAGVLLKLVALLSIEEPGGCLRGTAPWRELHLILTDLDRLAGAAGVPS